MIEAECTLKADNCVIAAQMAETPEEKHALMRLAATFRNEALRLQLGEHRDSYLEPNPLTSESLARWEEDVSPVRAPCEQPPRRPTP